MEQQEEAGTGPADEAYVPDPRRWRILAVSLLVGFMSLLDVTIVNVAVPSIRAGLDTSAGDRAVGGVGLRARVRHDARGRRSARRRPRPAPDDDDRAGRLRRVQRRGRAGAQRRRDRGGAAGPGRERRAADAAELRADPAAVPRRRAGPGVRHVRLHRRGRLGHRPAHRRCADRAARRGGRLAVAVPGQRADRAGRAGADPAAGARQRRPRRTATRGSTCPARCCSG